MVLRILQAPATERSWDYYRNERQETERARDFEASAKSSLTAEQQLIERLTQTEVLGPEAEKFLWSYAKATEIRKLFTH